jgi:hypothetical protein
MEFVAESFFRCSDRLRFTYDPASYEFGGRDARFLQVAAQRMIGRRVRSEHDYVFRDPLRDPVELGILFDILGYWLPENWPVATSGAGVEIDTGVMRES